MSDDVDGQDKVARATARQNEWIAKEVGPSEVRASGERMHDKEAPTSEEIREDEENEQDNDDDTDEGEPNAEEAGNQDDETMGETNDNIENTEVDRSEERTRTTKPFTPSPRNRPRDRRKPDATMDSEQKTATDTKDTPPRPKHMAASSTITRSQPTKRPTNEVAPVQYKRLRGDGGDEMDHGHQGETPWGTDSDTDSSEQLPIDVDDDGHVLNGVLYAHGGMTEMLNLNGVHKKIVAHAVAGIDVTEIFSGENNARLLQVSVGPQGCI